MSTSKTPIAILSATGTVGQKMIALLSNHPQFYVAEVAASPASTGKVYGETVHWRERTTLPEEVSNLTLKNPLELESQYILSALPGDVSVDLEPRLAEMGKFVISNASGMRMESNVPLIIPEVNGEHIELLSTQTTPGKILTNPNCATVFLCMELAPIQSLSIVTLQALSGAGYPGVASLDAISNIVPNISGEEEKIETEALKILGSMDQPADFPIISHVHRVPVPNGHYVAMHVTFKEDVSVEAVEQAFATYQERYPEAYKIHSDQFRPQPALDLDDMDQRAHIGRIKQGADARTIGLISFGHNLVRGAAGAAIANLENLYRYQGSEQ